MSKTIHVPLSIDDRDVFRTLNDMSKILNLKVNYYPLVPSTSDSVGEKGMVAQDDNYLYVCISDNTWKRVAISTW